MRASMEPSINRMRSALELAAFYPNSRSATASLPSFPPFSLSCLLHIVAGGRWNVEGKVAGVKRKVCLASAVEAIPIPTGAQGWGI